MEVKVNVAKLFGVKKLKTKDKEVYLCIPVNVNYIFAGKNGYYLTLNAYKMKDKRYNSEYLLKLRVPKDDYKELSEEEREKIPICGSIDSFDNEFVMDDISEDSIKESEDLAF